MDMESKTEALGFESFDWVHKETASARTVIVAENISPYRLAPIEIGLEKKNPTPKRILSCLLYTTLHWFQTLRKNLHI
jgi:hypothetical protein